jgi:hypothetical protein
MRGWMRIHHHERSFGTGDMNSEIHSSDQVPNALYAAGQQVIHSLNGAGFASLADALSRLCDVARDRELPGAARENALLEIEARCHVRWLGDLSLPQVSLREWWRQLEALGKSARKRRKCLQTRSALPGCR